MREAVMKQAHDEVLACHQGSERTYERVRDSCWWPNMYKDVQNWVRTCPTCQLHGEKKGENIPLENHHSVKTIPNIIYRYCRTSTYNPERK